MPRNGSGTYALPSGNPVTSGTTISSTTHNSTNTDIATALTDSIDKDGQTVITGAIDHNGNEIILDVDGDTSIHASTDDQIDIKVAGADDFVITANKFDVLAGSELKVNGQLELTKGADIASPSGGALAVDIDGNFFDVTGTNAITSLVTRGIGSIIALHFDGALVFTHDATNLILPGAANITTAAGDIALLYEYAAADWRVISYTKANGKAVVSGGNVYIPEAAAATADVAGSIQLWNKNTGTGLLHVTDDAGTDKEVSLVGNNIFINETSAAAGDTAGVGQLWVDDAVPNTLFFTNDAGTDEQLSGLGYQSVVQVVNVTDSAVATGTTVMPSDDTIPQQTEGIEFMTLAITPKSASNKLKIEIVWFGADAATNTHTLALFQDSTANALAAVELNATADWRTVDNFTHYMTAGTVSETTFKVRVGSAASTTTTFNGQGGGRKFGGVAASSITITEYTP